MDVSETDLEEDVDVSGLDFFELGVVESDVFGLGLFLVGTDSSLETIIFSFFDFLSEREVDLGRSSSSSSNRSLTGRFLSAPTEEGVLEILLAEVGFLEACLAGVEDSVRPSAPALTLRLF